MPVVSTDAIILQVFAYGETSRILRMLTATHGLQSAIAKGARRPRSRYALLEPFSQGVATMYVKETRDLQTLTDFELTYSRHRLGSGLLRFGGASLLAEIVLRATNEEPHPGLFARLALALARLEHEPDTAVESAVLSEAWQLVACLGFAPELDLCIDCDRPVNIDEDVRFDYAAGGMRCPDCADGAPGRAIPARARAAMVAMARGEAPQIERTRGHWWLLARYLDHHVLEGATLHSLSFLATATDEPPCDD
jgi:DNA repair protein RecO (recombination protein O)